MTTADLMVSTGLAKAGCACLAAHSSCQCVLGVVAKCEKSHANGYRGPQWLQESSACTRCPPAPWRAALTTMHFVCCADEYINSDDCWMVSCRNPALINKTCHKAAGCCDDFMGPQLPDPVKFPQGIPPVVDYIHSKGLKAGLYTSASPWTCAGFAASCQFEAIDAKQWADWKVRILISIA